MQSFFIRSSSSAFSLSRNLLMPSFSILLQIMFSLSLMIEAFQEILDPKNWVTFSLPSWHRRTLKVLEVELLDLRVCLRLSHWFFKAGTAEEHLTLYPYPFSFLLRLVRFTLERGRMLQESSLCSSVNLYWLFCSCSLKNNFKFQEVMLLRLLARFACLFLRMLSLMISEGVFFLRDLLKFLDFGLRDIDACPCSSLCRTKRF